MVIPAAVSTPAAALSEALAGQAEVTVTPGVPDLGDRCPSPPPGSLRDPGTGQPGLRLEFRDGQGELLAAEHRNSTALTWWDQVPPGIGWGEPGTITLDAWYRPDQGGPHIVGAAGVGHLTVTVDGVVVADAATAVPDDPVEAMARPGEIRATVLLEAGRDARIGLVFRPAADGEGPLSVRLGLVAAADEDDLLDEAEQAAREADAAVVVVGSAVMTESEGFDRSTLALPGRQDELVRRVAAVNPRTVVVVNAGMPVLMPWAGQVAAVIYAWLPGQAMGEALADVLLGRAEPGGRLPVTLPAREADCPVLHAVPRDGRIDYDEGLLVGYRGYDAAAVSPAVRVRPWSWLHHLDLRVGARRSGGSGGRPGPGADRDRAQHRGPARAGRSSRPTWPRRRVTRAGRCGRWPRSAPSTAAPGERAEVTLQVPARAFARWREGQGWFWPPGQFTVQVGRSSRDLRLSVPVRSGPA